jgi:hypothetical protein
MSGTSEIVLEAFDIVFPEVRSRLDLDDDHVLLPDIFDPVDGPQRDVEGLTRLHPDRLPVPRDQGVAPYEMPVFGPVLVPLQAEALPRAYEEPLDLAPFLLVQDEVGSPGAISTFGTVGFFPIQRRTCVGNSSGMMPLTAPGVNSLTSP